MPADFESFIRSAAFTCVGAKSAVALDALRTFEARSILSRADDEEIYAALVEFGAQTPPASAKIRSFACLFGDETPMSERCFEGALWSRLQALHDIDAERDVPWAARVSKDPSSAKFSMSVGGAAYFVVGLHARSSRAARRFHRPALVFNLHAQFERLRADGRYGVMQEIIRNRELALHGDINPMISDFGERGEAAQYSGRRVPPDWACPLRVKT